MGSVVDRKLLASEDVKPKVPMEVLILLRLSLYLFFIIWLVCTKKWSVRIENKIVPWGYIYRYMQTLYMIPTIKIGLIKSPFFNESTKLFHHKTKSRKTEICYTVSEIYFSS